VLFASWPAEKHAHSSTQLPLRLAPHHRRAQLWEAFWGGEARALVVLFKAYYEELVKDCIQNLFQKLRRREGLRAVQVVKAYLTDKVASNYFSLFMVMMMSGRFVGTFTFLMRYIAPNKLLRLHRPVWGAALPHGGPVIPNGFNAKSARAA
jgi:hypothetical protein